jgi:hypothetical protein
LPAVSTNTANSATLTATRHNFKTRRPAESREIGNLNPSGILSLPVFWPSLRWRALSRGWKCGPLLTDVRELILQARERVAQTVSAGLTLFYWEIGNRIRREILKERRAEYGEQIVPTLSAQLAVLST